MKQEIHTYTAVAKKTNIKLDNIDPIKTEIIRNALNSAANQMKQALCRTAFSPIIYEVLDFASAIYDKDIRLLSQAPSLPLFMGTLNFCVEEAVKGIGGVDNLFEGDIIIYNNPYGTGAHQPDVALVMPVFCNDQLIGYTAIKAHWLDIGAKDPYCSDTVDYFQEGLIFPGVKLFEKGKPVDSIHRIIAANSRLPESVSGDMRAQCVGLNSGAKAFKAIVDKYGIKDFFDCVEIIFNHGESVVKNYFKNIPNGKYTAQGMMDNDGITNDSIPFNISIEVKNDEIIIDYSDVANQQQGPVNCPLPSTVSAARIAISMLAGGGESPTEGHFRPIKVITKKNTIFNPSPPAPCFLYGWPAMQSIEVIYKAIGKVFPKLVPADSSGDICSMVFWGENSKTNEPWADGSPYPSGQGGSDIGDGSTVLHIAESATRFSSTEVRETMYPYILNKVEFAQDSCGAGKHRGGMGIDFYFEFLDDTYLTATLEKTKTNPQGLLDGKEGAANKCFAVFPNGSENTIGKVTRLFLPKGTNLKLKTGGGGGYGHSEHRTIQLIHDDIQNELISEEFSKKYYPQYH
ncbi:hydantoinase B/oxoprolinase family protein [Tenacibaculum xiamenense]|uniref:hydantoinase B/oxoprolinase family protein n=1 Tax=Tenacibaculum xiamenense TaxID=1261553 RepID=UPI0038959DD1